MWETKRTIIVGAAGFLGSRIGVALETAGWNVLGIVRRPNHELPFRFKMIDVESPAFDRVLEAEAPTLAIFAGGTSSILSSFQNPVEDFRQNALTFLHFLDAIRRKIPQCRVLLLSSAAVYGNPTNLPILEDTNPSPISPYGYHKLVCEQLAQQYHRLFGLSVSIARIFSAYGVGLKRQVMWDISRQIRLQGRVKLAGTGIETRDFIHVSDIAEAIVRLTRHIDLFDSIPYHVASGVETTIRRVAELLISNLDPNCGLAFTGERRAGDPVNWRADLTRLTDIGFQPHISIVDGIADYTNWVRAIPEEVLQS